MQISTCKLANVSVLSARFWWATADVWKKDVTKVCLTALKALDYCRQEMLGWQIPDKMSRTDVSPSSLLVSIGGVVHHRAMHRIQMMQPHSLVARGVITSGHRHSLLMQSSDSSLAVISKVPCYWQKSEPERTLAWDAKLCIIICSPLTVLI